MACYISNIDFDNYITNAFTLITVVDSMDIKFEQDKTIPIVPNKTILELALANEIPMAHVCGGNARCSTCRIILIEGECPPRNEREARLAEKLGWASHIRLSCQVKPEESLVARRVVKDKIDQKLLHKSNSATEKNLAILFSDIRSFTTFSERHLPHDIVHILNRYFLEMGTAIHNYQGRIDKYMGDGIMAIFGLDQDDDNAIHPAQLAYQAALEMLDRLTGFNQYLQRTYQESFQIGIGIHYGPVVVGNLGHPDQNSFTAIGDTVNVAARVESATKNLCDILVSHTVYEVLDQDHWESQTLLLKGKSEALQLYIVPT